MPKFSDEFAAEWLDDDLSDYHVARKVLFDYHPQEPDMWLQLAAQQFPVFKTAGSIFPIIAPYFGMPAKPDFVTRYEECTWKGTEMNLLEYLRKANKDNKPLRYIVEAYKRTLAVGEAVDNNALEAFARNYRCRGEKLIAADTVWRLNDRYYGQWMALNVPFNKWEDLKDEAAEQLVPDRHYHLAVALRRRSEYWREPGLIQLRDDMRLEAVNPTQVETVTAMILANTHLIDQYLSGHLEKNAAVAESDAGNRQAGNNVASVPIQLQYDAKQQEFEVRAKKLLDEAITIQTADDDETVERLSEKARKHGKAFVVTGPPGCGKTTVAKKLIRHAVENKGRVLCTYPTGQMQSRVRAELQAEGLEVDLDTCHGAFCLFKPEQDALPMLDEHALVIVDEFPQLSRPDFERIIRIWENSGKVAVLLFLGDFNQLPSISGTTAKDSPYWKHMFKVRFHNCWRSNDDTLLQKVRSLRKQVPNQRMRNNILRGHKAWNQAGGPTRQDLRKLHQDTDGKTTIVTCTRKAAQEINVMFAEVCVGRRHQLVELPGDYDANVNNYDAKNKLRADRQPLPCPVAIRKGLRLHLTRNLNKQGDFVNGMECVVKSWDETHRCLLVETITGKDVAVYQYTDPDPAAQNVSFFPIRFGYASTI